MLTIDGSQGEGGGQILRSSLTLSLVTGTPFRIENIRANRGKPGLMRQHLTATRAAIAISHAEAEGAELNSQTLEFTPGELTAGDYAFEVGTAGSTTLVLQTILPALATLPDRSRVAVEGGTHNLHAPIFEYLHGTYRPVLEKLGATIELQLEEHGFYPAGGGRVVAEVRGPLDDDAHLEFLDRGAIRSVEATSILAHLPEHIAERELDTVSALLDRPLDATHVDVVEKSISPGNVLFTRVESQSLTETFTVIGRKGLPAEDVAKRVAEQVNDYLASGAPVGPHLADQLVVPMATCDGGAYRTNRVTSHLETQVALVPKFMPVNIERTDEDDTSIIRIERS